MSKIVMIGDSTMQFNNCWSYPQVGWGQALSLYTKPGVVIENYARNGRSTKSFISEGRFDYAISRVENGDFVICQFGHNDEKISDESRYTNKDKDYLDNLAFFAKSVTEKGANIIFATSISRRKFENGKMVDTHLGYPQAMLKWCMENDYLCIDLNQLTLDQYNMLGEVKTKEFHMIFEPNRFDNYPEGKNDASHLVMKGAMNISELFVRNLKKTNSKLNDLMLDLDHREEIDWKMLQD